MLLYVLSWLIDFFIISLAIALFDEAFKTRIENNQALAAFLILFIPTLIEYLSYKYFSQPFMLLLSP